MNDELYFVSKPTWIWYPGDFEVWLGNIFNNRRTERGAMFPPFWKQDSHYVTVEFTKTVETSEEEEIAIFAEGQYNFSIDGKLQYPSSRQHIPQGTHKLSLKVWNQATPPTIFIQGKTIHTDATWQATYEDKLWIDENGIPHGSGIYVPVGSWHFDSPDTPPSTYHLEREEQRPVCCDTISTNSSLYDFGRETFGYLKVKGLQGTIHVFYGDSREEALDKDHCETLDVLSCPVCSVGRGSASATSKAFRYVYIEAEPGTTYDEVLMDYEYAPHDLSHCGTFRCSDDELNRIWDVAAYTMDLTTREFFMDGIKRDRWTWSGDAIQSYLMNYYLRFNSRCVRRTIRQLRGKDPVTAHVNTIMDYSFYWFKSVYDYYFYTGDLEFVRELYPRMRTLMDYCLGRLDDKGMAVGQPDDWIFVDWVDFPMPKRGVMCFEQILLCKALETMKFCAVELRCHPQENPPQGSLTNNDYAGDAQKYEALFDRLLKQTKALFWSDKHHAFMHNLDQGRVNPMITKFPNMFAILYGYVDAKEKQQIMEHVMLNDKIEKITTPYMRFYELEALCEMGMLEYVLQEIKDYWGGMIREGATSFWEKYNPGEHDIQHLAMYGRPYGKSLCHAWGASPVYLLGKYFLGVRPTSPGYATFEVKPADYRLTGDMDGCVPTPYGRISLKHRRGEMTLSFEGGKGELVLCSEHRPKSNIGVFVPDKQTKNCYRLALEEPKQEYKIEY